MINHLILMVMDIGLDFLLFSLLDSLVERMPHGILCLELLIRIRMIILEWVTEYWLSGKEMVIIISQQIIFKLVM